MSTANVEPVERSAPSPTSDDTAHKGAAARGHGSQQREVVFRDPPPIEDEAKVIKEEIARLIVKAPKLPVPLPVHKLQLRDITADRKGIELVIGWDAAIAAIRLQPPSKDLVQLGDKQPVVVATLRELHPHVARVKNDLTRMAERVQNSITREQWDLAMAKSKELLKLPIGVPMGFFRQLIAGLMNREGMIRTGFLCNQDCGMCWQSRDWGRFSSEQILMWIEDLAEAGAKSLIISGGEPTLDSSLDAYIRRAREKGINHIMLETNAIQFQKPGYAEKLRDAGLYGAFVSLHSSNPEVSDAITRAPGTHDRTVKGILALLKAGLRVKLNTVMTQEGLDYLADMPQYVQDNFGEYRKNIVGLMLSYPAESYDSSLAPQIIPDPVKLRRVLRETIDRAVALKIYPLGLDSPCGPQLCAFGADRRFASLRAVPEVVDFRNVYVDKCNECVVRKACFGLRDTDVKLYGDACAEPIREMPSLRSFTTPADPAPAAT